MAATPADRRRLLAEAAVQLATAGVETPERDAEWLLAAALGLDGPTALRRDGAVDAAAAATFRGWLRRRAAREPVSRILGRRGFWSLDLAVTPAVLDPRADTELLVERVLARVGDRRAPLSVVDLGTGSGCLLLALLAELPEASGIGVDLSAAALQVAHGNARAAGLDDRAGFLQADWGTALRDRCADILVSNPPYIASGQVGGLMPEVRDHDPPLALDGGPLGLDAYRRIVPDLRRLLRCGGICALEVDAATIGTVRAWIEGQAPVRVTAADDLAGRPRALIAEW